MSATRVKCAIIGSGNIGSDLMIKVMRTSKNLAMGAMIGIDPASDGLARAARLGVPVSHEGIDGLRRMPEYKDIRVVFDATSAKAHVHNDALLRADGKKVIDLTPAAVGPFTIPVINGEATPSSAPRSASSMPRSSPRSPRNPPGRARAPISTSSPRPRRRRSRSSAAPSAARR